jgi:hypothetical protein
MRAYAACETAADAHNDAMDDAVEAASSLSANASLLPLEAAQARRLLLLLEETLSSRIRGSWRYP